MTEKRMLILFWLLCGLSITLEGAAVIDAPLSKSLAAISEAFIEIEKYHHTDNISHEAQSSVVPEITVDNVAISSNSTVAVCGTVNLNKIVDELLDSLRDDIIKQGLDQLKIPDIYETFTKKIGMVKVKGEFKAENGWVKSLSTIYRTADVIAKSDGRDLSVVCGFGLRDLEVGYDKYKASFMELGPEGKLNGIIGKNSLLLNASLLWRDSKCIAELNDLSLDQFGGLKLNITGLGPLNWLFSKISTWVVKQFKMKIQDKLESTLSDLIEKQLANLDCSKYILGTYNL